MSDDRFDFPAPPPPLDPAVAVQWTQWLGQLRSFLILLGGIGIGGTWLRSLTSLSDAELSGYGAAAATLISLAFWIGPAAWSWVEKARTAWAVRKAMRLAAVAAAVASANETMKAGRPTPVTVTVTPPDRDNEAVRVSPAEAAAAPSVPIDVLPSPASRSAA